LRSSLIIVGVGFLIGILSGFLGLGGGVLLVPIMIAVWGIESHVAMATSLAVIVPTGIVSSLLYQHQGNLDLALAIKIAAGSIVGAYLGSTLACRLSAVALQKIFGGMLVIIGIRMVIG